MRHQRLGTWTTSRLSSAQQPTSATRAAATLAQPDGRNDSSGPGADSDLAHAVDACSMALRHAAASTWPKSQATLATGHAWARSAASTQTALVVPTSAVWVLGSALRARRNPLRGCVEGSAVAQRATGDPRPSAPIRTLRPKTSDFLRKSELFGGFSSKNLQKVDFFAKKVQFLWAKWREIR